MGSQGGSVPPPLQPRESFSRRYKFLWPVLLTVNLAVGGYVFFRTKKKETCPTSEKTAPPSTVTSAAAENTSALTAVTEPMKAHEPIPEKEQRELFKWMLEEKRRVKPKNDEEKKQIDEEKEILKQFIRAKTIPTF